MGCSVDHSLNFFRCSTYGHPWPSRHPASPKAPTVGAADQAGRAI